MQTITVTQDFINSNECNLAMLQELAMHKDFGGMQEDAFTKLLQKPNSKGETITFAKLRQGIVAALQNNADNKDVFAAGSLQFEFNCLPDLLPTVGAAKASNRKETVALKGAYVVKNCNALKCTAETDPGKFSIWKHVWACTTFEQYFATAPKKAVTATGRVITASSEIRWAVQRGWIAMVQDAPQQEPAPQQDSQPATDTPQQEVPPANDTPQQDQPAA